MDSEKEKVINKQRRRNYRFHFENKCNYLDSLGDYGRPTEEGFKQWLIDNKWQVFFNKAKYNV